MGDKDFLSVGILVFLKKIFETFEQ